MDLSNVGLDISFVTEGYLCLAAGADFTYETARKYILDMHVFSGTASDNVSYLSDETTTLDFYAIGKVGLRAGLRLEISAALICKQLAQVKGDVLGGVYAEANGFFFATLQKKVDTHQQASYQSDSGGAVYVEVGAFIEIGIGASALGGFVSFDHTLLDKKWPLWSTGNKDLVVWPPQS